MKVTPLPLPGLLRVEPSAYSDARGFFLERFNRKWFLEHGLPSEFMQDNLSHSRPGVLRGLHYQTDPPQGKLIGVIRGRIWDVLIDLRPDSPTFKQNFALELNETNRLMIWAPAGFAHGFCVLGDDPADVFYKTDAYYNQAGENGIFWADPDLAIAWPVKNPIVSAKDEKLQSLAAYVQAPGFARTLRST